MTTFINRPNGYQGLSEIYIQGLREIIEKDFHKFATDDIIRAVECFENLLGYVKNNHAIHMGRAHKAMIERKGFCSTCQLIAKAEGL